MGYFTVFRLTWNLKLQEKQTICARAILSFWTSYSNECGRQFAGISKLKIYTGAEYGGLDISKKSET